MLLTTPVYPLKGVHVSIGMLQPLQGTGALPVFYGPYMPETHIPSATQAYAGQVTTAALERSPLLADVSSLDSRCHRFIPTILPATTSSTSASIALSLRIS